MLYAGTIDADLHPFRRDSEGCDVTFGFSSRLGEIGRVYLFCRYEVVKERCSMDPVTRRTTADHDRRDRSGARPRVPA